MYPGGASEGQSISSIFGARVAEDTISCVPLEGGFDRGVGSVVGGAVLVDPGIMAVEVCFTPRVGVSVEVTPGVDVSLEVSSASGAGEAAVATLGVTEAVASGTGSCAETCWFFVSGNTWRSSASTDGCRGSGRGGKEV